MQGPGLSEKLFDTHGLLTFGVFVVQEHKTINSEIKIRVFFIADLPIFIINFKQNHLFVKLTTEISHDIA